MAWKNNVRYLYKNRRIGKRVVTEYLGSGYPAELLDQLNERARQEADSKRQEWQAIKDEQQRLDQMVSDFGKLVNAYATAILLVNGYRQHRRSVWRRRRT